MRRFLSFTLLLVTTITILVTSCNDKNLKEYTLSSGTSYYSKDGFRMKIRTSYSKANKKLIEAAITIQYISDMGSVQKVLTDFGDLATKDVLQDSFRTDIDTFKNVVVHPIKLPSDGKKYWFVPFDPKQAPWPASLIISGGGGIAIGCCCGEAGDGCYVSEDAKCLTKVCAACTNASIAFINPNQLSAILLNTGFALVQADILTINGKKFQ